MGIFKNHTVYQVIPFQNGENIKLVVTGLVLLSFLPFKMFINYWDKEGIFIRSVDHTQLGGILNTFKVTFKIGNGLKVIEQNWTEKSANSLRTKLKFTSIGWEYLVW